MRYNPDAHLCASDAARALQTSIAVILMWRNRGWVDAAGQRHHLTVAARDETGRPLYRWGDLLTAELGARRSRQRIGLPQRARQASPYERRRPTEACA